CQHYYTAPHCF
nr:immunoglobulin light chain junction region [Macaca mulatta]MPN91211.1 immunoglobulin light chain junction region [Macaca mulatta]MPN91545.1 immunoglobulin light chain junction region [Macaca mulatta]MPN92621.1 immunoglobulin light chain junction region [Macaca mulatta]MPN94314.1 immunoglobulin light chain junction region [Macaca mulatta]